MANELNSDAKVAAQIVLGLVIVIITLLFALPRFPQVELVLKLISEAVGTLVSIVVLLQQLIHNLHQIISIAHDGFSQVELVLELISEAVGTLVSIVVLLLRLIRICKRIWSIWTARARQTVDVANDHQNESPTSDVEGDVANGQNDEIVNEDLNI